MVDGTDVEENGAEVEKWFFRILALGLLATFAVAVVGSMDDIKRYMRIRAM